MKYILLLLCASSFIHLNAQEPNWRQLEKTAEALMTSGNYATAADQYELAWREKPTRTDLLAKAAEGYRLHRDYRKAAELYKNLIGDEAFPLAGLQYARCLKQEGQYDIAKTALIDFEKSYTQNDKGIVAPLVQGEIKGCDLAQNGIKKSTDLQLEYLSNINTPKDEFAPLPYSDDILYFSSAAAGKAKILRSQRNEGKFGKAIEPNLPRTPGGHFCHGAFTPDNERFYFTVCQGDENWKGNQAKCDLYVTMRENNNWTTPLKLRDYVKMDGTTATQPFVMHDGDTEILFFSSDRSGGKGGLDIWYMTRQIAGKDIDFTFPINAGSKVNTIGDEISPYYNADNKKLYFSSNGHVNIGGFDIFVSRGEIGNWKQVENLGLPYNSSADDYYFAQTPSGESSFFVSNRLFGAEKVSTTDDDIFTTTLNYAPTASVSGSIYDRSTGNLLTGADVLIYEKVDAGLKRLLKSTHSADGQYSFPVLPEREFFIEAQKDGYGESSFEFSTFNLNGKNPGRALYLEKTIVSNTPPIAATQPTPVITTAKEETPTIAKAVQEPQQPTISYQTTSRDDLVSKGIPAKPSNSESVSAGQSQQVSNHSRESTYTNSRFRNDGVTTTAPKHSGTYFKVQLSVVLDYNLEGGSFAKLQEMGRLDTEYIIEKGWTRVLLADFFDLEEARKVMQKAQLLGFPEAFIVRYNDGYRMN